MDLWTEVISKKPIKKKVFLKDSDTAVKHKNFSINTKKVLCQNIIRNNMCPYADKCNFAHNMNEQTVDTLRKTTYDIIINGNYSNINEKTNGINMDDLYKCFIQLTKICDLCINKKCTGFYNCKNGVFDMQYQVCHNDLHNGICYIVSCNKIHLTNKGLKSFNEYKKEKYIDNTPNVKKWCDIANDNNNNNNNSDYIEDNNSSCLFEKLFINKNVNKIYDDLSDESDEEFDNRVRMFINDINSIGDINKSIFD